MWSARDIATGPVTIELTNTLVVRKASYCSQVVRTPSSLSYSIFLKDLQCYPPLAAQRGYLRVRLKSRLFSQSYPGDHGLPFFAFCNVPTLAQLVERETVIGYTCISRSPDRRWFGGFFCIHNLLFYQTRFYTKHPAYLTHKRCALVHRPLSTGCVPDLKEEGTERCERSAKGTAVARTVQTR